MNTGESSGKPTVDGSKSQLAVRGTLPGTRDMVEYPFRFGSREVGIKDEAGFLFEQRFMSGIFESFAGIRGASILPDEGPMNGLTCLSVPKKRRFALIGDADSDDLGCVCTRLIERGYHGRTDTRPDFFDVVFNVSWFGVVIGKFRVA